MTVNPEDRPERMGERRRFDSDVLDLGRRGAPRLSSVYRGKLAQRGKVFPCTVTDLSLSGARVKLDCRIDADAPLRLMFDRLGAYWALNVHVAWTVPGQLGVRFLDGEETRRATLQRLMPARLEQVEGGVSASRGTREE